MEIEPAYALVSGGVLLCRHAAVLLAIPLTKNYIVAFGLGSMYSVSDTDTFAESEHGALVWQYCRPSGGGQCRLFLMKHATMN